MDPNLPPVREIAADTRLWKNEYREKILKIAETNTYFFCKGVLWYHDITLCHKKLCDCLDGRGDWGPEWRRALICAHRGWLKSSIIRGWALREALHKMNWSARYFGSSQDNAEEHFLRPLALAFKQDDGAEFRLWLYDDRIPKGFAGWTEDTIALVQTNATRPPALSIRGITSKREGYHGNAVLGDDLEGSEAEKETHDQVGAREFISSATPLLINPGEDRIVISGTVHGEDPVVYRLAHEDLDSKEPPQGAYELDNSKRVWKMFWQPLYNGDGTANWKERYTPETIELLKKSGADAFAKNYLLLKGAPGGSLWKRSTITSALAKWKPGRPTKDTLVYPYLKVDLELWKKEHRLKFEWEQHEVRLDEMFYTGHFDPKHKEVTDSYKRAKIRPSKAAIIVVGTTPDAHHIVVDAWNEEASIDAQIEALYGLHEKWGFRAFTYEPIGAQVWVKDILIREERYNPRRYSVMGGYAYGPRHQVARLSSIAVEDKRSPKVPKEDHIFNRLDPLVSLKQLHVLETLDPVVEVLVGFPNDIDFIDLADALAQGATTDERGRSIWQPPIGQRIHERHRAEQALLRSRSAPGTHYRSPLAKPIVKPEPIHPALRGRSVRV